MNKEILGKIDSYIESNKERIFGDLKTLVSAPSVSEETQGEHPFGEGCAQALDIAIDMAGKMGFTTENANYYYGLAHMGKGEKSIGIFSHIDVVPPGDGWDNDPYNMIEKDGFLVGRGVADNKNAAVVGLHAMKCLQEIGVEFDSRICLYFGCSEETGMGDLKQYIKEQKMPDFSFVPDTNFPVCHGEKGIMAVSAVAECAFETIVSFAGGLVSNMVPDSARAVLPYSAELMAEVEKISDKKISVARDGEQISIVSTGISSHAASPEGSDNAITRLARAIVSLDGVSQSDKTTLNSLITANSDNHGENIGIAHSDEPSGKLTCINGTAKTVDGKLVLSFNIRYPVTHSGDVVAEGMKTYFSAPVWSSNIDSDSAPMYMPKDDSKVVTLCGIYENITGKKAVPYVMGGGTYARYIKNAVGFGIDTDTKPDYKEGHGGVHQPNEALLATDLLDAVRIYVLALIEIDKLINVAE